ncbi:MAG: histidine kinase N-terminal domain-containing protein [Microthrixaceae bacterium]|nr:histidine kinase N-terminal domain-containing protein [Acidimicrobiales bacterium]MCB9402948.1 histidine kinase N-terminal domain-containing protein [Microthrixaceae bacterium]
MASLAEIVRNQTPLAPAQTMHLQRLVASWNMLADFCFADLVLYVPVLNHPSVSPGSHSPSLSDPSSDLQRMVVVGHVRPSTAQTVYRHDLIGDVVTSVERPIVARAMAVDEIIEGEVVVADVHERVRALCIPVRHEGETIAVLSRESTPSVGRSPGELERTYSEIFNRFARMIAVGQYPFRLDDSDSKESPRVGDGVVVLDRTMCVEYASPNAVSALHRMGVHANAEGRRLGEVGLDDEPIRDAFTVGKPVTQEVERGDVIILLRCIPMLDSQGVSGAVVLFRDVTEVRIRDRLLLSKDATIREIHHRVKNNLQTISSLLRLQSRRTSSSEARDAIAESVRRIQSIALVHETLSREAGEEVSFTEILRPLVQMVAETVSSPDRSIDFEVVGDAGTLPAQVATPMAVVLNELLQNAADHAFPAEKDPIVGARVTVGLERSESEVVVTVSDNGVGVPDGFDLEQATGLGLSIVRALVVSDLRGSIELSDPVDGEGAVITIRVPLSSFAF